MYPSVHQHPKYADGIHNYPQPAVTLGVPAYNAYNNNNNNNNYPQMPLPLRQQQHGALRQQQHGGNPISSKWTTGICGCCEDCSSCCLTCWCPCITFGQIAEIADSGSTSCGVSGFLYALMCASVVGCPCCCYSCFYRKKLRAKFNLAEKPCGDWLAHCFCESCALCQEYRELKNRGFDPALGWRGNLEKHDQAIAHSRVATAPPMVQAMNK